MVERKKQCFAAILTFLLLFAAGCADKVEEPPQEDAGSVALTALFCREDGASTAGAEILIERAGAGETQYLGEDGKLFLAETARESTLTLSLLEEGKVLGAITLELSVGAVTDASTDSGGTGHITLRENTEEICLLLLLSSGKFDCSLYLAQNVA